MAVWWEAGRVARYDYVPRHLGEHDGVRVWSTPRMNAIPATGPVAPPTRARVPPRAEVTVGAPLGRAGSGVLIRGRVGIGPLNCPREHQQGARTGDQVAYQAVGVTHEDEQLVGEA